MPIEDWKKMDDLRSPQISWWRLAVAFAFAPMVPAFILACIEPGYAGIPSMPERIFRSTVIYAEVGGYLPMIALGIPAFLLLRKRMTTSVLNCALVGALVASTPWLLLGLFPEPNFSAYSGGHVTFDHGLPTLWGLIDTAILTAETALLGALAGVVFWAVATWGVRVGNGAY